MDYPAAACLKGYSRVGCLPVVFGLDGLLDPRVGAVPRCGWAVVGLLFSLPLLGVGIRWPRVGVVVLGVVASGCRVAQEGVMPKVVCPECRSVGSVEPSDARCPGGTVAEALAWTREHGGALDCVACGASWDSYAQLEAAGAPGVEELVAAMRSRHSDEAIRAALVDALEKLDAAARSKRPRL